MLSSGQRLGGMAGVLIAAVLWGTTGTAATYAPGLSPLAVGAVAMGIGGLLQGLIAAATIIRQRVLIIRNWHFLLTGAVAVAVYPLAFYASMHNAGVTVGTVISIGSAPILSALIECQLDGLRLTRQWMCGAGVGVTGMVLLCLAESSGNSTANDHAMAGIFLGLLAGFTYAFYSCSARRLMQAGVASRAAMGVIFGAGGILLMPVLLMTGAPPPDGMEQCRRRYLYGTGSDVSGVCLLWLRTCAYSGQYGNHNHSAGAGYSRAAGHSARR